MMLNNTALLVVIRLLSQNNEHTLFCPIKFSRKFDHRDVSSNSLNSHTHNNYGLQKMCNKKYAAAKLQQ